MTGSIVLNVCAECDITAEEFFGHKRSKKLTEARCAAIHRLRELGLSYRVIGRLVKRNHKTVQYWLSPEYRDGRLRCISDYHAANRRGRPRLLTGEQEAHLLSVYLSGGITAARPLAVELGVHPRWISRYARSAGVKRADKLHQAKPEYHELERAA